MIIGVGTDIIKISRIKNMKREFGDKFLNKIFTNEEKGYCEKHYNPSEHYAVRFAAKEAVAKALGSELEKKLNWKDISITNNKQGKPVVCFSEKIKNITSNCSYHISLSHCSGYATAVVVVELE